MYDQLPDEHADYLAEHVREALATDDRVTELDVRVVIEDNTVIVRGNIGSDACRDAIPEIIAELLPDYDVQNDTVVSHFGDTVHVETIS